MKRPPLLSSGSRVALVAPSGPLRDELDLQHAIDAVRSMGWEPVVGDHVRERKGYLAGADEARLADLNHFATDRSVDGIWCIRGGYGAMRILDQLDYSAWHKHPKILIGYSDITALHCALTVKSELVSYHGPTARSQLTEFTRVSLQAAVVDGEDPCGHAPDSITLHGGRARGRLVGGNLALLASLCGTSYLPSFDDSILVLEDVNESVYRVDRMLTQLRLGGALRGLTGIAFGHFTEIPDEPTNLERSMLDVLAEVAEECGVPCLASIPLGHIANQWTIPLGETAQLDADARTLSVHR